MSVFWQYFSIVSISYLNKLNTNNVGRGRFIIPLFSFHYYKLKIQICFCLPNDKKCSSTVLDDEKGRTTTTNQDAESEHGQRRQQRETICHYRLIYYYTNIIIYQGRINTYKHYVVVDHLKLNQQRLKSISTCTNSIQFKILHCE